MSDLYVGGDIGGNKADFVLVDDQLRYIDHLSVQDMPVGPTYLGGIEESARAIKENVAGLIYKAQLDEDTEIAGAFFGVAGLDTDEEEADLTRKLATLKVARNVEAVNDGTLPRALLPDRVGVVAVAGFGSIVQARNAAGESARVGGNGPLFDQGSGRWLGLRGLEKAEYIGDGRQALKDRDMARELGLTELPGSAADHQEYLESIFDVASVTVQRMRDQGKLEAGFMDGEPVNIEKFEQLHDVLYHKDPRVGQRLLTAVTPKVIELAWQGNGDANRIIAEGAAELSLAIRTAAGRLALDPVPLVVSGSTLVLGKTYFSRLVQDLSDHRVNLAGNVQTAETPVKTAITMARRIAT